MKKQHLYDYWKADLIFKKHNNWMTKKNPVTAKQLMKFWF